MVININGKSQYVKGDDITYQFLLDKSFGTFAKEIMTVTYKRIDGTGGSLKPGESVTPEDGMIFNVAFTDNA